MNSLTSNDIIKNSKHLPSLGTNIIITNTELWHHWDSIIYIRYAHIVKLQKYLMIYHEHCWINH
jgi:hypothetical protein